MQFLSNLHAEHQAIYLSRHGQNEQLSGEKSAATRGCLPWARRTRDTSGGTARRCCVRIEGRITGAVSTVDELVASPYDGDIPHPKIKVAGSSATECRCPHELRNLGEIYAGVCDGMTYERSRQYESLRYAENKLGCSLPSAESYLGVISIDPRFKSSRLSRARPHRGSSRCASTHILVFHGSRSSGRVHCLDTSQHHHQAHAADPRVRRGEGGVVQAVEGPRRGDGRK